MFRRYIQLTALLGTLLGLAVMFHPDFGFWSDPISAVEQIPEIFLYTGWAVSIALSIALPFSYYPHAIVFIILIYLFVSGGLKLYRETKDAYAQLQLSKETSKKDLFSFIRKYILKWSFGTYVHLMSLFVTAHVFLIWSVAFNTPN